LLAIFSNLFYSVSLREKFIVGNDKEKNSDEKKFLITEGAISNKHTKTSNNL